MTRLRQLVTKPETPFAGFVMACLGILAINLFIDGDAEYIHSDGCGYYAWARSIAFDRDVRFSNEFAVAPWPIYGLPTAIDGGPLNRFTVGLGLIELVPMTLASLIVEPFWPSERLRGYGAAHLSTVAVFLLTLGMSAFYVLLRQVRRDHGTEVTALIAWSLFGATPFIEYSSRQITYTHLMDMAVVGLLWVLAHRQGDGLGKHLALGFLASLATILRMTNVLVLPWIAAWYMWRGHRPRILSLTGLLVGAAVPLGVQLATNLVHRGAWLPEPYPDETFSWLSPRVFDSLFSPNAGWLAWHPVYLLLIAGLVVSWRTFRVSRGARAVWIAAVFAVVGLIWTNAAWWAWDGGVMQFGHRLFLVLTPMLLIMTAYGTRVASMRAAPFVVAALVVWNMYLFVGVVVTQLDGNWNPRLDDALGWERRIIPAVRDRLQLRLSELDQDSGTGK